jgi:hypothetical protein
MVPQPTGLQRQSRLGAIERLDLALFVDRQHHRVRRRIDVEADHVAFAIARPVQCVASPGGARRRVTTGSVRPLRQQSPT